MADPKDIWRCQMVNCGYMYDPDRGDKRHKIPAGIRVWITPDDWRCPVCGAAKSLPPLRRGSITHLPFEDDTDFRSFGTGSFCMEKTPR